MTMMANAASLRITGCGCCGESAECPCDVIVNHEILGWERHWFPFPRKTIEPDPCAGGITDTTNDIHLYDAYALGTTLKVTVWDFELHQAIWDVNPAVFLYWRIEREISFDVGGNTYWTTQVLYDDHFQLFFPAPVNPDGENLITFTAVYSGPDPDLYISFEPECHGVLVSTGDPPYYNDEFRYIQTFHTVPYGTIDYMPYIHCRGLQVGGGIYRKPELGGPASIAWLDLRQDVYHFIGPCFCCEYMDVYCSTLQIGGVPGAHPFLLQCITPAKGGIFHPSHVADYRGMDSGIRNAPGIKSHHAFGDSIPQYAEDPPGCIAAMEVAMIHCSNATCGGIGSPTEKLDVQDARDSPNVYSGPFASRERNDWPEWERKLADLRAANGAAYDRMEFDLEELEKLHARYPNIIKARRSQDVSASASSKSLTVAPTTMLEVISKLRSDRMKVCDTCQYYLRDEKNCALLKTPVRQCNAYYNRLLTTGQPHHDPKCKWCELITKGQTDG